MGSAGPSMNYRSCCSFPACSAGEGQSVRLLRFAVGIGWLRLPCRRRLREISRRRSGLGRRSGLSRGRLLTRHDCWRLTVRRGLRKNSIRRRSRRFGWSLFCRSGRCLGGLLLHGRSHWRLSRLLGCRSGRRFGRLLLGRRGTGLSDLVRGSRGCRRAFGIRNAWERHRRSGAKRSYQPGSGCSKVNRLACLRFQRRRIVETLKRAICADDSIKIGPSGSGLPYRSCDGLCTGAHCFTTSSGRPAKPR
jgi:hypothetical protein